MTMKARIGALLLVLFGCCTRVWAGGELTLNPNLPMQLSTMKLAYTPDSAWKNAPQLYAFVYHFREANGDPLGESVPLSRAADGIWRGEVLVRQSDVYLMLKVSNGKRSDDNGGAYWETIVSVDGVKPAHGAKLRAGITYIGALPENCVRAADFQKALALMGEELKLYPNNLSARIAETSLAYELKTIKSEQHQKLMKSIVSTPFDTTRENDTRSMIRALNALGRSDESQKLQTRYIEKFPVSGIADEYVMWQMQNTANPAFFIEKVRQYTKNFPQSANLPMLHANMVAALRETGQLRKAEAILDSIPNVSAMAYNELAKFTIRFDSTEREAAVRYAKKAVDLARQNRILVRPAHLNDIEWQANTAATLGDCYNTLTSTYFEMKRNDEALATFYQAREVTKGELPSPTYAQAVMLLMLKKQFQEALQIASQGTIMNVGGDKVLTAWHRTALDSLLGVSEASIIYNDERAKLVDSAQTLNLYRQFLQRLDRPLRGGNYSDINRKSFEIDKLSGKVTFLLFWSSWAEPCQKMIPIVNALFKKYANSGVVNFVVIDTWEDRSSDRYKIVRDFMAKNKGLYFNMFIDDEDKLAQKYGIMGIPTRLYIDKLGRIQYKSTGYDDSAAFVEEVENTLGLLLADKFYYFQ